MTIKITAVRTGPAAAALPPAVSLRRIFWMVLAAHLVFVGLAFVFGGSGSKDGGQVSTSSRGEPEDLNAIVPEKKAAVAPKAPAPSGAEKTRSKTRAATAAAVKTAPVVIAAGKSATAGVAAGKTAVPESVPKKLITRAKPRPAPTSPGGR
ncbi:MAG: hypothetical protein NTV79_00530 [Candidatus Aureabacteria bacterium]|nr:hypothetical protein [Candidatus Auribacterota bacterium]